MLFSYALALKRYERNKHLLHRNTAMLDRVLVVPHILVVVIRISEERVVLSKDI